MDLQLFRHATSILKFPWIRYDGNVRNTPNYTTASWRRTNRHRTYASGSGVVYSKCVTDWKVSVVLLHNVRSYFCIFITVLWILTEIQAQISVTCTSRRFLCFLLGICCSASKPSTKRRCHDRQDESVRQRIYALTVSDAVFVLCRGFFSCLTDKRRSIAPPDALPATNLTPGVWEV